MDHFKRKFPSVINARILVDTKGDRPKKYGFVRFADESDSQEAIEQFDGGPLLGR
jgi:RNA recognition motif-containing protein